MAGGKYPEEAERAYGRVVPSIKSLYIVVNELAASFA